MKKIATILLLIGLATNSYSQLNYFFPDSNSYFSVSWMKFWFEGDTVFDNLKYKKVYLQTHDSIADFKKASYFTAIREDTIAEKVYFYYKANEYLLYDFSVNVGDVVSFYSLWPWWQPTLKEREVLSIDSILIDNHYRKRINFIDDGWRAPESWIEGIGSTNGIFFPGYFYEVDVMDWTVLLCVHINERLIYHTDYYNNCYVREFGVNISENKKEIFKIYPTVADKVLYIETGSNVEGFDYKIISMQGQIVGMGQITSNTINIANLNHGIYLILVSESKNKKSVGVQKIIKL